MLQDQAGCSNGSHVLTNSRADNLDGMDQAGRAVGIHQRRDFLKVAVSDPAPEGSAEHHPVHVQGVGHR